ncbi:hypothetical protein [uncultured Draconibacterium sp.]|uniref:hypothetical protein n=1 Tax=uncultured Draconibacterium sp. TaxID=1573823 RepID=UPI00321735FF
MKFIKLTLFLMLFQLISIAATAQQANARFAGLWSLKGEGSLEHTQMVMKLELEGERLVGAIRMDESEPVRISRIDQQDTTVLVYFTISGTNVNIRFQSVDQGHISGKVMGVLPVKGERLPENSELNIRIPEEEAGGPPEEIRRKLMEDQEGENGGLLPIETTRTISSTITVNCTKAEGKLIRTERYNNLTDAHLFVEQRDEDVRFLNGQGLHGKIYKLWIDETSFYDKTTGKYNYDKYADYISDISELSDYLLLNFNARGVTGEWGGTAIERKDILTKVLVDLKKQYPGIRYVELMNEPDYSKHIKASDYYPVYKIFYEAVNAANLALKPAVPIELGGPATAQFDINWIGTFLDAYKSDPSPYKRLDFISFHGYFTKPGTAYNFFKDDPSLVKDQRAILDKELSNRGLDTDIPAFVTEMGIYPGPLFDDFGNMKNDALRQAAGILSITYWYLNSGKTYPFNWVMRHQTEGRKDQLVSRDSTGAAMVYTNKFTPYGNAMLMLSKMKKVRVNTTASTSIEEGKGLYNMACADSSGVSILLWNYQGKQTDGYNVDLRINDIKKRFKHKKIRVKIFRIDNNTSNYHYDLKNCNLQTIYEEIKHIKDMSEMSVCLKPNSLQLIVLDVVD